MGTYPKTEDPTSCTSLENWVMDIRSLTPTASLTRTTPPINRPEKKADLMELEAPVEEVDPEALENPVAAPVEHTRKEGKTLRWKH